MPQKWLQRRILRVKMVNHGVRGRWNRNLQPEEHKNFRPDSRRVFQRVRTKGLEGSKHDEDGCPAMIERERKMDEELIREVCGAVGLLDDIVDVLHSKSCCQ